MQGSSAELLLSTRASLLQVLTPPLLRFDPLLHFAPSLRYRTYYRQTELYKAKPDFVPRCTRPKVLLKKTPWMVKQVVRGKEKKIRAPDLTKVDSEQTNLGGDSRSESGCNESGSAREPNVPHDLLMRARDAAWTPFPSYLSPVPDGLRKVLPPRRRATLSRRKWGKRRRLQTRPSRRERAPAHPPHAGTR